jgi:hypothetical protein
VTTTQSGNQFKHVKPGQFVNQVYAAALNFSTLVEDPVIQGIAKDVLKGMYRATITAGWAMSLKCPGELGSKKLVLTILGGASFSNPFSYIVEAILSCEDLIVASGLDVYLVCFQDREFNAMWDGSDGLEYRRAKDQQFEGLKGLVKRTNGTVIDAIE